MWGLGVEGTPKFPEKHPKCFSSELSRKEQLTFERQKVEGRVSNRGIVQTHKGIIHLLAEAPQLFKVLCQLVERRDLIPVQREYC